jgi:hypothetical protein
MAATSSAMLGAAISNKAAVIVQMVMSLEGDNRGISKLLRRRAHFSWLSADLNLR